MKLKLLYFVLWSVKIVAGENRDSINLANSLTEIGKSEVDECLLCNKDTIGNSINYFNISYKYSGKL